MVVRVGADDLRLIAQRHASLHERLFESLDVLEEAVCHSLVAQRPQPFRGLQFGRAGRQKFQVYPLGHLNLLARVPSCLVYDQQDVPVLAPQPISLAKWHSAMENASTLTVGRISQWTSPVAGRTEA